MSARLVRVGGGVALRHVRTAAGIAAHRVRGGGGIVLRHVRTASGLTARHVGIAVGATVRSLRTAGSATGQHLRTAKVELPQRRTLAVALLCIGVALGSGGMSLLLWGGTDATTTASAAPVDRGVIPAPDAGTQQDQSAPVAAPVRIDMPTIHTTSALVPLQLQDDGALAVPTDPAVAGWWSGGTAPGGSGPAVIVGHVDSLRGPAVFYGLSALHPGDVIEIGRADGSTVRFAVDALRQYPKNAFPTDLVYGPTSQPTLRLVTCGGEFTHQTGYADDLVVFAHLVRPAAARTGRTAL